MSQAIQSHALAFGCVDLLPVEGKHRKFRRTFGREVLSDANHVDLRMFLPFSDDYVNYLGPLGTQPLARFSLHLEFLDNNFRVTQHQRR